MIKAKKSLGQNFLVDAGISQRIVEQVGATRRDIIIEIGPGEGAITGLLLKTCGYLVAVEIDQRFIQILQSQFRGERFKLVAADALKIAWQQLISEAIDEWKKLNADEKDFPGVRVVANLPYYISTPILERLLNLGNEISDLTLMLQEEVVDRITATPGNKEYGYLTVFVEYHAEATKLFRVSPQSFRPVPGVWSALLHLKIRKQPPVEVQDNARFFALIRAAFAHRRKTILNNLKSAASTLHFHSEILSALKEADIEPQRRAETLSLKDFERLYQALFTTMIRNPS
ncbi:MAG: 16S rRNA (adenine(1518)-N(6)/adenine(1519)-N(6))-dimethyltransferase RsmA [Acidobacteriota bacterium]